MKHSTKERNPLSSTRYLTLVAILAAMFFVNSTATAQTETVLYNFTGGADGAYPASSLLLDTQGNLYGATPFGGASVLQCGIGCGVIFEVSPAGTETIFHTFSWSDGAAPNSLLRDTAGNIYLTTQVGGTEAGGAALSFTPAGTENLLFDFPGQAIGVGPRAGLIRDAKGNLYGTAQQGGYFGGSCSNGGCGTVFKISPTVKATVLYNFTGAPDAFYPTGGLTQDAHGNLWGTTTGGGAYGNGAVFQITPAHTEAVIYSFTGQADGGLPVGGLIHDAQGNFYGMTAAGGYLGGSCSGGCGTVFKMAPDGTETVLYSFKGVPDGDGPSGGLIRDSKGNFYGTTELGGNPFYFSGSGTVFKLSPAGKETVLYKFTGGADGAYPLAGLVMDQQGNLYGTTEEGGSSGSGSFGYGTVFKVVP